MNKVDKYQRRTVGKADEQKWGQQKKEKTDSTCVMCCVVFEWISI